MKNHQTTRQQCLMVFLHKEPEIQKHLSPFQKFNVC